MLSIFEGLYYITLGMRGRKVLLLLSFGFHKYTLIRFVLVPSPKYLLRRYIFLLQLFSGGDVLTTPSR